MLGVVCLSGWIICLALGDLWFDWVHALGSSFFGRVCTVAWVFALFYHLLNGIRHLCWDVGWGFELPQVYVSGYVAMVVAGLLTGVVFMFS